MINILGPAPRTCSGFPSGSAKPGVARGFRWLRMCPLAQLCEWAELLVQEWVRWYVSTGHSGRSWVGDGGRKTEDRGPESGKDLGLWVVPLLASQTGQDAPGRTWLSGNAGGPGAPQSAVWTASSFPKEVQECHLPQLQHMQGLTLNAMGVNLRARGHRQRSTCRGCDPQKKPPCSHKKPHLLYLLSSQEQEFTALNYTEMWVMEHHV